MNQARTTERHDGMVPVEQKSKAERIKNAHGQYFTPRPVADLMVGMLHASPLDRVLEPCSGAGVFLDALTSKGFSKITAVEIDEALADHETVPVLNESFVAFRPSAKFDAVIGNPPYIRWKDLSEDSREEMRQHGLFGELFNSLSDYLTVFVAGSIELLEDGGELIFITPSFWMHTQHSEPLREWMLKHGSIETVVDFGEASVFEKVSSAIVIFRYVKGHQSSDQATLYRYVGPRKLPMEQLDLLDENLFVSLPMPRFQSGGHWSLASEEELKIADALEDDCRTPGEDLFGESTVRRLGDFVQIANGMVSGLDKAFRIPPEVRAQLNQKEEQAILPAIKGMDTSPYLSESLTDYIDIPIGLSEEDVARDYPNFYEHLLPWQDALERRYSYQRELPFWEWAFRRSENFHLSDRRKGYVPCKERLTNKTIARFTLSPGVAVATQDVTAFSTLPEVRESIEYVVAFLCHPAVTEWVRLRGLMKGGIAEFSERPLASIPFREIDWDSTREREIHDEITTLMKHLPNDDETSRAISIKQIGSLVEQLLPNATEAEDLAS